MPTLAREPYDPNPDPASLGSAGRVPNTTVTTQGASDFPARPQFRRRMALATGCSLTTRTQRFSQRRRSICQGGNCGYVLAMR
jgi:hypothetical protein